MPIISDRNILNVTELPPAQKHPAIFARFDKLEEGEGLTIFNDHDPKPLYYQFLAERGNVFTWEYLEQGPEWWKVRISKRKRSEADETLGELAAKDLKKVMIFKKYGLDFCCGGKKTVKEACAEKGLDVTKVEEELQQTDSLFVSRPLPYNEWSLDFLCDYIINTHHTYVYNTFPELIYYAEKVADRHGKQHPELIEIVQLVRKIVSEMNEHMIKEEEIVFPYIKSLLKSPATIAIEGSFSSVKQPIELMETEHEEVGKLMEEIRTISNNYALPKNACASYTVLYRLLREFEEDLHMHVHLENNILFVKAIQLEKPGK